jgi:hypothetical protein
MGSNVAGRAHTSHHEANLRVQQYRPATLGLVVGAVPGAPGWHAYVAPVIVVSPIVEAKATP